MPLFNGDDMKTILAFDTETTGLPNWKIPSDDTSQPHLVQLSGLICDAITGQELKIFDEIIKPDGWIITDENAAIHGITHERAMDEGKPESEVVGEFISIWQASGASRVAHNRTFDQRIIRIALKRYFPETQADWAVKDDFEDTMYLAKSDMQVGKNPKLIEAYQHYFGKGFEGAHNSLNDARACKEIYIAIKNKAPAKPQQLGPGDFKAVEPKKAAPAVNVDKSVNDPF